ncbi:MAG: hypothetical protein JJT93_14165, partial [Gammaproteobacteria bacterium]|nr:hypothetical protein [Gammaproteobacteria bacterium]
ALPTLAYGTIKDLPAIKISFITLVAVVSNVFIYQPLLGAASIHVPEADSSVPKTVLHWLLVTPDLVHVWIHSFAGAHEDLGSQLLLVGVLTVLVLGWIGAGLLLRWPFQPVINKFNNM